MESTREAAIEADVARMVRERVARAARPKPCRCGRYPFPHRRVEACDELEREAAGPQREDCLYFHDWDIARRQWLGDPEA